MPGPPRHDLSALQARRRPADHGQVGWLRRITEHPTTRVALLILAGAQAMVGAFILGLAVNIGTSSVGPGAKAGPFSLVAVPVAGIVGTPTSITVTADGSLWFTDASPSAIGRIDAAGAVTRSPTRLPWAPGVLTPRGDGGVWFTDPTGAGIGSVTPSGTSVSRGILARGSPRGVVAGPDGNVWFTFAAEGGGWIGRMSPAGEVTRFLLPPNRHDPGQIVAGPDGNLWFAMADGLGRITPAGEITPVEVGATAITPTLTAGPDKAIWFARNTPTGGTSVGRVDIGRAPRVTAVYDMPAGASLRGIVTGSDGNLWVAEEGGEAIARVTTRGQVTQYSLPPGQYPEVLAAGKGRLYFTFNASGGAGGVGRFDLPR